MNRLTVMAIAGVLGVSGSAAIAQTPGDLTDLIGARAAGAETALRGRGYDYVRGETGDDRVWTYWWNERARTCITVATLDGRYSSITTSPAPDCKRSAAAPATLPQPLPAPSQRPGQQWFDLGLVCFGEGRKPAFATRYGYSWDYDKAVTLTATEPSLRARISTPRS